MGKQSITDKARVVAKFSSEMKIKAEIKQLKAEPVLTERQVNRIEAQLQVLRLALEYK